MQRSACKTIAVRHAINFDFWKNRTDVGSRIVPVFAPLLFACLISVSKFSFLWSCAVLFLWTQNTKKKQQETRVTDKRISRFSHHFYPLSFCLVGRHRHRQTNMMARASPIGTRHDKRQMIHAIWWWFVATFVRFVFFSPFKYVFSLAGTYLLISVCFVGAHSMNGSQLAHWMKILTCNVMPKLSLMMIFWSISLRVDARYKTE